MSAVRHLPLRDRLRALAEYLPQLESPGFVFGHWHEAEEKEPGVYTMPYFADGPVSLSLIQAAYESGLLTGILRRAAVLAVDATNKPV